MAAVVNRVPMQELPAEADEPMPYSGPWRGWSQTRLLPPGGTNRGFHISINRLSEREPPINFGTGDLRAQYCYYGKYGFVGLDGTATRIHCKLPDYDFPKAGLKRFINLRRFEPAVRVWVRLRSSTDDGTQFARAPAREQREPVSVEGISDEWLQRNKCQGLLLCRQYPVHEHRVNFAVLLAEPRSARWREKPFMFPALPASTRLESHCVQYTYGNPGVVLVHDHELIDWHRFP